MATETLKCGCGQEFEASEWALSQQCEDCEHPPTPEIAPAGVNFYRSYLEYVDTMRTQPIRWSQPWTTTTIAGNARVGETITLQAPTPFAVIDPRDFQIPTGFVIGDTYEVTEEINGR